jgi:hypothetical protein
MKSDRAIVVRQILREDADHALGVLGVHCGDLDAAARNACRLKNLGSRSDPGAKGRPACRRKASGQNGFDEGLTVEVSLLRKSGGMPIVAANASRSALSLVGTPTMKASAMRVS